MAPVPPRLPRVLLVDGDAARKERLVLYLETQGYKLDAVTELDRVVDHVVIAKPDVILLDIFPENRSGIQICRQIRVLDGMRLTPIILMASSVADEDTIVTGLTCGADDYVVTTASLGEINARIRVQLRNRRDRELLHYALHARARYKDEAFTDPLTGIPNRRAADQELSQAVGEGLSLAVLILDLDHFKAVNDSHGHGVGDEVLRRVASCLDSNLRQGDLVARFGGEEFVVICRSPDNSLALAERLRAAVEAIDLSDTPIERVTISVGVAICDGGQTVDVEPLLEAADQALYQAKSAGRNTVKVKSVC